MNRVNKILVFILGSLVVLILFVVIRQRPQPAVTRPQNALPLTKESQTSGFEMKTSDENSVSVGVTPLVLSTGQSPRFKVAFDTHTGDLGFKVEDISSLTDDKGRLVAPARWSGSPPGGHHISGELDFDQPLGADVKSVTLVMKNVADVPKREFTWTLF